MATNENLPPKVIKQLAKELKYLDETPPEGIRVGVNDENFSVIYADIEGPAGTPYESGVFRMKLILSHDFPQSPPKGLVGKSLQFFWLFSDQDFSSKYCNQWLARCCLKIMTNTLDMQGVTAASTTQKKDTGPTKVTADKRKMDARKKSLKRL